jgi:hypothetical protein
MIYGQSLTHILLFDAGYTPINILQQSAWFPLHKFLQITAVRLHFETHHFDESHFKMAQDKLLIFGGLVINTNRYQTMAQWPAYDSLYG